MGRVQQVVHGLEGVVLQVLSGAVRHPVRTLLGRQLRVSDVLADLGVPSGDSSLRHRDAAVRHALSDGPARLCGTHICGRRTNL